MSLVTVGRWIDRLIAGGNVRLMAGGNVVLLCYVFMCAMVYVSSGSDLCILGSMALDHVAYPKTQVEPYVMLDVGCVTCDSYALLLFNCYYHCRAGC